MSRPFYIKEAKLPEGFPVPGPVGQVILKEYPAYRRAAIRDADERTSSPNGMFMPLFNHIKRNEIAMTAPVEMSYRTPQVLSATSSQPRPTAMAFLYRLPCWGKTGVDESDPRVLVEDVPAGLFLSTGVRGDGNDPNMSPMLARLEAWLAAHADRFRAAGPPRYLGYNSPFVPRFLRYGEVQIPVERIPPPSQGKQSPSKTRIDLPFNDKAPVP